MRTMASLCFLVIVLVSVQKVFGNDVCLKKYNEFSCNECIRCGGEWCKDAGSLHCSFSTTDGWCGTGREDLPVMTEVSEPGTEINPIHVERTLYVGKPNKLDIRYSAKGKQKPEIRILDSTQTFNIELVEYNTECRRSDCVTTIEATPTLEFCNATGRINEYVDVRINLGLSEPVRIKYHVACACPCSAIVESNSPICHRNGNFSCGYCACEPGWKGEYCDKPICDEARRGDVSQCSLNPRNDDDCSGNGYCGICETCVCYTDREGSQYFDQDNYCQGLCTVVASEWEYCLVNNTIGDCYKDGHSMTIQAYNESLTKQMDTQNRKIWVRCNESIDDCGRLEYFAKRDENGKVHVMMLNHCNEIIAEAVVGDTKVPIILGVLGIVAAVAAVSGVLLWKHMNAVPPVPLNDPQYQNIDAEDCTGENPLYKPPTSSFKNPTYGKW